MNTPILAFEHVNLIIADKVILNDISFALAQGEVLGIVGESGAGKSTILNLALGIKKSDARVSGRVLFQGKDLFALPEEELRALRGKEMGMIFQDAKDSLCPVRRIGTQLVEYVREHEDIPKRAILDRAGELLQKVGFKNPEEILKAYAFELSGGMNQRVGLVYGLILQPSLLLADEPTSALDEVTKQEVMTLLGKLLAERTRSMLLVSHDMQIVGTLAKRIMVLKEGRIIETGTKEAIFQHPKEAYTQALLEACLKRRKYRGNYY
jgi:ABC-type dipeptide/oligopeptide/nickel transport system, ATPase component